WGMSFITLSAVTDLPQPDSPTTPSVSLLSMCRSTPSTARTVPSSVKKYVLRFLTSSRRSAMCDVLSAPGGGDLPKRVQGAVDVVSVHVLVGDAADRRRARVVELDLPGEAAGDELGGALGAGHLEANDIGLHGGEVDAESRQGGQAFGEPARVEMILRQPLHHGFQGHDPRRGEHARLPHSAADHLAYPPRPRDE